MLIAKVPSPKKTFVLVALEGLGEMFLRSCNGHYLLALIGYTGSQTSIISQLYRE